MKLFPTILVATTVGVVTFTAGAQSSALHSFRGLLNMAVAPVCVQENGFDYVGNDLANKPGQSADCCAQCDGTVGCNAWSWSDHNGGTCWLKRGMGTVSVSANVKSGVKLESTQLHPCGDLEYKTDYVGFDIGNVRMLKPQDCCYECSQVEGCRAFTHTSHNGGTCWLKSQKGRMVYNEGATSSVTYGVTTAPSCGLETNVDYVGNDIGSAKAAKAEDCCGLCQKTTGCKAFSWTNQDGGTCYFKNRKDQTTSKSGVTSCAVLPNPRAPSCAMQLGTDYVGNDIGNALSADSYGCCSICMKKDGCKAFSWTNLSGGTCWLKSGKGATAANANVQSAVI